MLGWVLLAAPVATALAGPLVAGSPRSEAAPLRPPSDAHPLGTDVLGRDVLALVLTGGRSVLLLAGLALLLCYLAGVPLALLAAGQRHRWLDEALLRVLDLLLALPGLLVLLVLAATGRQGAGMLIVTAAALQLPAVVRLVRGAALAPGCRAAVEAMTLQGEPWWRIHLGYVGRTVLGPTLVDAGSRLILVLYLIASANFLGFGLEPSTSDWAVLIERNREAVFIQPLAVLVPAALLVVLCTGGNLVVDRALANRRVVPA
ncbi:MAG: ABC transporter permease subunit [Pseudonocardiaceae bacterium]|nr:ABC transporter permease subunit [Pseudonocardiaceae bacterium]